MQNKNNSRFFSNSRPVPQAKPSRTSLGFLKTTVFILSAASFLAYLLVVNGANTMGIEIGEMQYRIKQLADENRDLESQAADLKTMSRIEAISLNELAMVKAETYQYLNDEGGLTVAVKK